ncbi:enoyl-CoA hydratase/isomerase family protein [Actinomadura soli]|uniref:Enoyl-CoA hydratase/isomerase family protein n=2 Tax=Actinomadura soli TaxID=2508997 RepID=A0A5C4JCL1_9ACTN|nr:enoyl-CoA hydratase/isomerase family protein [Actinomadura soli]
MNTWAGTSDHVDVTVRLDVAVITLNRPEVLNALTARMRKDLAAALRHHGNGQTVRGLVITGAGRAFSAGEDLREAARRPKGELVAEVELFHDITRAALETRVPVVAALNGIAVGGAAEMTLGFDARIGTPAAEYLFPENDLGLAISNAASLLLPRLVGNRALRLVLDSSRINARDALSLGLLDEIAEPPDLTEAAIDLVHRWTRPRASTAVHLRLLRPSLQDVERAIAAETMAVQVLERDGTARAGIDRFLAARSGEAR